jgi:hypothetical protein
MIFARTIGVKHIVLECAASFEPAAGDIFKTFADLARSGKPLRAGLSIRFGWSLLTLAEEPEGLRICEPRFSGDPFHELNPTLDTTIGVLVAQVQWLRLVGERGADVFFDQQILLAPNALLAPDVFALRGERTSEADSGWSISPVPAQGQDIDTSHLTASPVYRLVNSHLGLMSILTLPQGYLVRLRRGEGIEEVVEIDGPDGRGRWRAP